MTQHLIGLLQAQAPAQGGGSPITQFLPLVLIFGVFYFLIIMPQQKKAKLHQKMLNELKKGDDVVVAGGILGRIMEIKDDVLIVNVDDGVKLRVQRGAVAARQPAKTAPEPEAKAST